MRQACGQAVKHHIEFAADQIGDGQGGALVGDVHHKQLGLRFEQLGRQLHDGAVAAGGVVEPSGVLFGVVDPFLDGLGRRAVGHQHDAGRIAHLADRGEVLHRVVRHARVEVGANRVRAGSGQQQGVAIGRGLGHQVRAQSAACARAVFDHQRHTHFFTQLLGQGAGKQIRGTTGRKRHDQTDRLGRVSLGMHAAPAERQNHCGAECAKPIPACHEKTSLNGPLGPLLSTRLSQSWSACAAPK